MGVSVPWVAKIFGPAKPLLSRVGDRQPEQQTLVVPQRQCLRLVVYLPVQWSLPPTRGTTACPGIVAHITKRSLRPRCGCSLVFYSPECVETEFSEVRRSPAPRLPSARPIVLATPATSVPSPPAPVAARFRQTSAALN